MSQNEQTVGVILAAGIGSRLRPLTNFKPKCLVRPAGKPILQYQLDAYVEAGIKEVFIVVGYEKEAVIDYCKHIKNLNIHIIDNIDYENNNNMYSLYLARHHLKDKDFILHNADIAIEPSVIKHLCESPEPNLIAVDCKTFNEEGMKASVDSQGYVNNVWKTISEKDAYGCSLEFYKFSKDAGNTLLDRITHIIEKEGNEKEWTEVAMRQLFDEQKLPLKPLDCSGLTWYEVDNSEDLAVADRLFSSLQTWQETIKAYYFDLDGTIYLGDKLIEGSKGLIEKIRSSGKKVFFVSNNSSKNKEDYVKKLSHLGISCSCEDFILSTDHLIVFLKDHFVKNIFILGTQSFKEQLEKEGFIHNDQSPEYVVVGYDTELNYSKLVSACRLIHKGVDYIATHCDIFCPSEYGPLPDVGAFIRLLEATTGRSPSSIFGKPAKGMLENHIQTLGLNPQECLMVGDRLHTDYGLAQENGMRSAVVLSGETTRDVLEKLEDFPDVVLSSIADLIGN